MPDRDPALEKALKSLEARMLTRRPKGAVRQPEPLLIESGIIFGWHAAFRSLGAGTPEAVTALRELVTAVHQHEANLLTVTDQTPIGELGRLLLQLERPARAFARVATPPEEGR